MGLTSMPESTLAWVPSPAPSSSQSSRVFPRQETANIAVIGQEHEFCYRQKPRIRMSKGKEDIGERQPPYPGTPQSWRLRPSQHSKNLSETTASAQRAHRSERNLHVCGGRCARKEGAADPPPKQKSLNGVITSDFMPRRNTGR